MPSALAAAHLCAAHLPAAQGTTAQTRSRPTPVAPTGGLVLTCTLSPARPETSAAPPSRAGCEVPARPETSHPRAPAAGPSAAARSAAELQRKAAISRGGSAYSACADSAGRSRHGLCPAAPEPAAHTTRGTLRCRASSTPTAALDPARAEAVPALGRQAAGRRALEAAARQTPQLAPARRCWQSQLARRHLLALRPQQVQHLVAPSRRV